MEAWAPATSLGACPFPSLSHIPDPHLCSRAWQTAWEPPLWKAPPSAFHLLSLETHFSSSSPYSATCSPVLLSTVLFRPWKCSGAGARLSRACHGHGLTSILQFQGSPLLTLFRDQVSPFDIEPSSGQVQPLGSRGASP